MKRSSRLLLTLMIVEIGFAGLWLWLNAGIQSGKLTPTGNPADTIATISSTIGAVMGGLAALCLTVWIMMRRRGI